MKSTIPGLCALINEQITEQETALSALRAEEERLERDFEEDMSILRNKITDVRQYVTRLSTCVNILQELRETLKE